MKNLFIFFLLFSLAARSQDITLKTTLTPPKAITLTTATGLGYVPGTTISVTQTASTLNDNGTEQPVFASAQDVWTVQGSTLYEFEGFYDISSGATSHTMSTGFALAGGASVNWIKYTVITYASTINVNVNTVRLIAIDATASTVVNAGAATTRTFQYVKGFVSINAAGTFQPTIKFSVQTNGTTETNIGSYFKLIPIGVNSTTTIGPIN